MMSMFRTWLWTLLLSVLAGMLLVLSGCVAEGHRRFELEIFGATFRIEDQAFPNTKGEQVYSATFDEDAWRWIFGWLDPDEPPADDAEPDE